MDKAAAMTSDLQATPPRAPITAIHAGAWPASPLAAVGQAFDALAAPPTALAFDTTGVPALPRHWVPLWELRRWLLDRSTSPEARDGVWRELVAHSRRPPPDGPAWTVAALGLALPGL